MPSELFRYLAALTLASSVAILIAFVIRIAVRRLFGVAAAYSTWLLVPVALVAVILPHAPDRGSILGIPLEIISQPALSHALGGSLAPPLGRAFSITWSVWVVTIWGIGAALFAAYVAAAQLAFINNLGRLSGSGRILRAERAAGCPALLGVIRPKIVLPVDFETRYTRLERLLIFSHERAHLRHGDAAWNALVALLRCLFWFNPLVHLAAARFRVDQELACDAAVVRGRPGSCRSYASAMLKSELSESALPVGCHWQSVRHFKERLKMLSRMVPGRARRTCGYICVTLASALIGYAAWAAEPALRVPETTASDENPVQLRGQVSVKTIDGRRMLLGVSSSADGQIDHLFLYTSRGPIDMKITLSEAPSTIDYRPATGLHFTTPGPQRDTTSGFTFFLGSRGTGSSVKRDGVSGMNLIGVSLGLSHYVMQRALSPIEFQALSKTDDCDGGKSPCIRAAGKIIPFPG